MCGAFFIPKITVDPTDNKTGTADTGTCRNKKDRQGKEKLCSNGSNRFSATVITTR